VGGREVRLEPQAFDVLAYLAERRGRVVRKEELRDEVWSDRFVGDSALTTRIKAVRRAVGDDGSRQAIVHTVPWEGLRVQRAHRDRAGPRSAVDIRTFFRIFAVHASEEHRGSMRQLNDVSTPGVVEGMLAASGFSALERGSRTGSRRVARRRDRLASHLEPRPRRPRTTDQRSDDAQGRGTRRARACRDEHGMYRTRSDQQYVTARKP